MLFHIMFCVAFVIPFQFLNWNSSFIPFIVFRFAFDIFASCNKNDFRELLRQKTEKRWKFPSCNVENARKLDLIGKGTRKLSKSGKKWTFKSPEATRRPLICRTLNLNIFNYTNLTSKFSKTNFKHLFLIVTSKSSQNRPSVSSKNLFVSKNQNLLLPDTW